MNPVNENRKLAQLAIDFAPVRREPRYKVGQLARLLTYLQEHDGITQLEAFYALSICRLSERCRELERHSYLIGRTPERTVSGARVIRYRLK